MLCGNKIPYRLDGRDNLMEVLLDAHNQATIAHHDTQTDDHETELEPPEMPWSTYDAMPARHWK